MGSPALLTVECKSPRQVRLANALCRAVEVAASEGLIARSGSPTLAGTAG
jgi:hypothetical protein